MIGKGMLWTSVTALLLLASTGCCVNRPFCGTGTCGDCAGGCGDCGPCGGLFGGQIRQALTCTSGCGDVYVDEWVSDPPECCDPCDNCGVYTGPQCCGSRPLAGLMQFIAGYRYCGQGDCCDSCSGGYADGGCSSCSSCGHGYHDSYETYDGTVIEHGGTGQPTPADPPATEAPAGKSVSTPRRFNRPYYSRGLSAQPASQHVHPIVR